MRKLLLLSVAILLPAEGRWSALADSVEASLRYSREAAAHPRLEGPFPAQEPPERFLCEHPNLIVMFEPDESLQFSYNMAVRYGTAVAHPFGVYGFADQGDGKSTCLLVVMRGTPVNSALFRHELGHCCGWNHEVD